MTVEELKKGVEVWCWWESRYLYYTGMIVNGKYVFEDICDAVTMVSAEKLKELKLSK